MNTKNIKPIDNRKSGFTIIEVVLVLAIAGLIFLMVFIALQALQKGQRDTQRKQDLSRISVQLTNYSTSARGNIPDDDTLGDFVTGWLKGYDSHTGDEYRDPSGEWYTIKYETKPTALGQIGYYDGRVCAANGEAVTDDGASPRDYAFTIKLEGQEVPYCVGSKT